MRKAYKRMSSWPHWDFNELDEGKRLGGSRSLSLGVAVRAMERPAKAWEQETRHLFREQSQFRKEMKTNSSFASCGMRAKLKKRCREYQKPHSLEAAVGRGFWWPHVIYDCLYMYIYVLKNIYIYMLFSRMRGEGFSFNSGSGGGAFLEVSVAVTLGLACERVLFGGGSRNCLAGLLDVCA